MSVTTRPSAQRAPLPQRHAPADAADHGTARPAAPSRARAWWEIPGTIGVLALTAVLYLWGLSRNGDANSFYAAAVQAGTHSWKALLFGSLDWGNTITVDKPPASMWLMGLSGRVFGFSSWSMLAPEAVCGIASAGLIMSMVKRAAGPAASIFAGLVFALTPVAVLMFRFNNPDALLVFSLVAAAYCELRAIQTGKTRWVVAAGALVGLGFLAKLLQAALVLPGFALAHLWAARGNVRRRIAQLGAAIASMVVSGGWFVVLVALWPAGSRPYIGGSTDNSLLQLAFGYNGLQRISSGSSGGMGGGGANFSGAAGIGRLFNAQMGGEIAWLIPAAIAALVGGLWFTRHLPRTNLTRAALLLWGGWFIVTALTFSSMSGTVHTYYAVALVPAVAALIAIGGRVLWARRNTWTARIFAAFAVIGSASVAWTLLERDASWHPALRYSIAIAAAIALLVMALPMTGRTRLRGTLLTLSVGVALLAGPAAWTLATVQQSHTGSTPSSGPAGASSGGFGGGRGGMGGTETSSTALVSLLEAGSSGYTWAAATTGAQSGATLQLSSDTNVMSIGGFTGSDPSPTLAQFEALVSAHRIHYYVAGGGMGGPGGSSTSGTQSIATWVAANFTATTVGTSTVYDLTAPTTTAPLATA